MFENNVQMNRHAAKKKHKRRLKKIYYTYESMLYRELLRALSIYREPADEKDRWWRSIYTSYADSNRTKKRVLARKRRRYYENQIDRYLKDNEFEILQNKHYR